MVLFIGHDISKLERAITLLRRISIVSKISLTHQKINPDITMGRSIDFHLGAQLWNGRQPMEKERR